MLILRKSLKPLFIILILVLISGCDQGCLDRGIEGKVIDARSGDPVSDVYVCYNRQYLSIFYEFNRNSFTRTYFTKTDSNGVFKVPGKFLGRLTYESEGPLTFFFKPDYYYRRAALDKKAVLSGDTAQEKLGAERPLTPPGHIRIYPADDEYNPCEQFESIDTSFYALLRNHLRAQPVRGSGSPEIVQLAYEELRKFEKVVKKHECRDQKKMFDQIKSADKLSPEAVRKKINSLDRDGLSLLHHAILDDGDINKCRMLIEKGADVNIKRRPKGIKDPDLETPLHYAAGRGYLEIVELLVESGADMNAIGHGETPLEWAAAGGYFEVVKYLFLKGAQINISDAKFPPLIRAINNVGKCPRRFRKYKKATPVPCEPEKLAIWLINKGTELNVEDTNRMTPLICASRKGVAEIVDLLFEKGVEDVNHKDASGLTALHYAANRGALETVLVKYVLVNELRLNS